MTCFIAFSFNSRMSKSLSLRAVVICNTMSILKITTRRKIKAPIIQIELQPTKVSQLINSRNYPLIFLIFNWQRKKVNYWTIDVYLILFVSYSLLVIDTLLAQNIFIFLPMHSQMVCTAHRFQLVERGILSDKIFKLILDKVCKIVRSIQKSTIVMLHLKREF